MKRWRFDTGATVRLAIAVAILMVLLFPVYWLVVSSLESALEIFHSPPSLLPVDPSLSYLGDVLGAQAPHLLTSLIVSVGTVALSLAIAVPAAYALSQLAVRWTGIVVLALLIVQMIPQVVLGIPYYLVFEKLRLLNSYEGLILADSSYSVPFIVIVLRAYLLNIPKELREASLVDGAGELRTLLRVIVPVGAPGIVAGALFAFLFAWNDFFFALTLTNTPNIEPMTLSLYLYVGTELQQWNLAMAAAAFAAVPSVLLVVGAQRYIRGGLTAGSVRG